MTTTVTTPRVLVCDDTPAKRYVLASWLRRAGYDVVESATAAEASATLRGGGVDLAILDVHLPDASGVDVTREVRADAALSATPVIHVSAVAIEAADQAAALDEGADAYLVDPIEPEVLLSTVRRLLHNLGARRQVETLATRLSRLNRAAVRLNLAASLPRLVESTASAAAEVFDGPAVAFLVDETGEAWRVGLVHADQPARAVAVSTDRAGALRALPDSPVVDLDALPAWADQLPSVGGGWVGVPVRGEGGTEGVVAVQAGGGADDADDTAQAEFLLSRLAQSAAVAAENIQALAFEHRTALTLQRSLLPQALPEPDGLRFAARYRASQQRVEVGGDFYDAFEIDGHCFLVIGDVQGHSLEAAVVMAELRYSLRAYAYDGHPADAVLDRLDALLVRTGSDLIATVCVVVIAPDRTRMSVVTAGHPAPLLLRDGAVTQVDVQGTLLGAGLPGHEPVTHDLRVGDRLLLFTDGLVERRDADLQDNIDRLGADAVAVGGSCEEAADALLAAWGGTEDDLALLVVDCTGPAAQSRP